MMKQHALASTRAIAGILILIFTCGDRDAMADGALPHPVDESASSASAPAIVVIPRPVRVEQSGAWRAMAAPITIACDDTARKVAMRAAEDLRQVFGALPPVQGATSEASIRFELSSGESSADVNDERYTLSVKSGRVTIHAASAHGAFNGWRTLMQIVEQGQSLDATPSKTPRLPDCEIVDQPRYRWRGMHLDVSRHFFDVAFIKRYIDLLAYHKLNVFHWHLTDDQGWRIEIRKYPKLTAVGAWRMEGGEKYGGFYTQAEVREIVDYAAERFVTIVPEIEMPGHARAALAAYPEYSCTGGPFDVPTTWGVFDDVYCSGNDATFEFIENVLDEVCRLFPGSYIHIGGDECPKKRWESCAKCQARIAKQHLKDEAALQSDFMHRVEKLLEKRGRRLIGWDEILEGGLAPNASVMSWRGMEGGLAAANEGHDVVMCPTSHCYFDYRQSAGLLEKGPAWSQVTDTKLVFGFEPTPAGLDVSKRKHILGSQGNIWTEWLKTPADVEYMAFPRGCALAEILWSPAEGRDWPEFERRLETHLKRLKAMRVNYRPLD
ncbi:MAG TPA: beta-N-acetylhexosaminidase [Phycisphaerae bacterium]|nr:beta-N-acetylhexosaminidase [Phycisphaerae bacterium]HRW55662.1 beta-N-acetylhexosaminidase [Phycisphaerae bacterium]